MNGLEGLNVNVVCPFQVQDYLMGFRMRLDNSLKKYPDSLFMKKSMSLDEIAPGAGSISFDSNFDVKDMVMNID